MTTMMMLIVAMQMLMTMAMTILVMEVLMAMPASAIDVLVTPVQMPCVMPTPSDTHADADECRWRSCCDARTLLPDESKLVEDVC